MEEGMRAAIAPRLSQPVQLGHFVLVVAVTVGGGVWTLSRALADLRGELQKFRIETRLEFQDTRLEIQDVRIETRDLITDLRKELRAEIAEVRSDLSGQMEGLRSDLSGQIRNLRGEVANRGELLHPASESGRSVSASSIAGNARTHGAS